MFIVNDLWAVNYKMTINSSFWNKLRIYKRKSQWHESATTWSQFYKPSNWKILWKKKNTNINNFNIWLSICFLQKTKSLEVHIFILVNTAVSINMQHIFPINNGYENIFSHLDRKLCIGYLQLMTWSIVKEHFMSA